MESELEDLKKKTQYLLDRSKELDAKAYTLLKARNELLETVKEPASKIAVIEQQLQTLGIEKDRLIMESGRAIEQIMDLEAHEEKLEGLYQ